METIIVTQKCWDCGCKFDIMYLQDGNYLYLDDGCDCESPFSPVDGQPSISQWLETFDKADVEAAESLRTNKACKFCLSTLYKSEVDGYTYQCFRCDEDFYAFEQE